MGGSKEEHKVQDQFAQAAQCCLWLRLFWKTETRLYKQAKRGCISSLVGLWGAVSCRHGQALELPDLLHVLDITYNSEAPGLPVAEWDHRTLCTYTPPPPTSPPHPPPPHHL